MNLVLSSSYSLYWNKSQIDYINKFVRFNHKSHIIL